MGNEHEESRSPYEPVKTTLDGAGTAHTAFDLLSGEDPVDVAGEMFSGEASLAKGVLGGFGLVGTAAEAVGSGIEIAEGIGDLSNGRTERGIGGVLKGTAGETSVVGTLAGVAGKAVGGEVAAGATGFKIGYGIGEYGSNIVEREGWLHTSDGEAATPGAWAADIGHRVEDFAGGGMIDRMEAGMGATLLASLPGAVMATGGAIYGAAKDAFAPLDKKALREWSKQHPEVERGDGMGSWALRSALAGGEQ